MRRYRSALILLLILALMSGAYYFYTSVWPDMRGGGEDGGVSGGAGGGVSGGAVTATTAPANISLITKKTDDLTALTIEYLNEEYIAVKETVTEKPEGGGTAAEKPEGGGTAAEIPEARWVLANHSDFRADASKLSGIASSFCSISSNKTVEENAADLAQYGFGGPASALVTGKFSDGSLASLEFGDKNPTGDGYYVRIAGTSTVYLTSTYSVEKMLINKAGVADLKLFALEEPDISRMEMDRGGKPVFSARRDGEHTWELDSPLSAPLDSSAQGLILDSVSDVSAVSCEEIEAADLAQYGLDAPKYTLRFICADGGGPVELMLGDEKSAHSTRYAKLGGDNNVYVLSVDKFSYLDKPAKEFVDVFVYIVSINQVNHITAVFDGRTVEMDVFAEAGTNTGEDRFFVDGVEITEYENDKGKQLFRVLYQSMIGITRYDIEPDAAPADENAEISLLYGLKDEPYTMLVEFVPKDGRLYYVFRNKSYAGIVVEKRLFDKPEEGLRAAYAAVLSAIGDSNS